MIYESETECKAATGQECKKYETATVVDDCSQCVSGVQPISISPTGNYIWMVKSAPTFWEWFVSFFSKIWAWLTDL